MFELFSVFAACNDCCCLMLRPSVAAFVGHKLRTYVLIHLLKVAKQGTIGVDWWCLESVLSVVSLRRFAYPSNALPD